MTSAVEQPPDSDATDARPPDPMATAVELRQAMGAYVTGVTIVTTTLDGVDHAMTANAFTSVSLNPPLVLLCVERTTRFYAAVIASGVWAVSILDARSRSAAAWLATKGRPLEGQLDGIPHGRGRRIDAAVLDAALATLECRTRARYDGGDHDILLAEVLSTSVPPPDGVLTSGEPLLYFRGAYGRLPVSVDDLPGGAEPRVHGGEPVR